MKSIFKNKYINIFFCFALALVCALCRLLADQSNFLWDNFSKSNHGYAGIFYFVAIFILFYRYLFKKYKNNILVWILGVFSSIINQLYYVFLINDIAYLQGYEKDAFVIVFFLNVFFYKSLYVWMLESLDSIMNDSEVKSDFSEKRIRRVFFLILGVFFGLYYIAMFPGSIQYDSASMLETVYGIRPLSMDNPILQIGFMYILKQLASIIGATFALGLYTFLQNIIAIELFSEVLLRIYKQSKKLSYIMLVSFIVLAPFMHYACSVGKDYPFALAILFMSLLIYDLMENPEEILQKKSYIIKLCISIILVSSLRNVGLYLSIASTTILALFLIVKYKKKAITICISMFVAIAITAASLGLVGKALGAIPEKKSANKSIPLMQIARIHTYLGPDAFTNFEYDSISKAMDIKKTNMYYREGYSDYIKDLFYEDISSEDEKDFKMAYCSLAKRHYTTAFQATYLNCYAYFVPGITTKEKPIYFFENNNMDNLKPYFSPKDGNRFRKFAIKATFALDKLPIGFLKTTGFIQYFHFIALFILLASKKRKYIIVIMPSILYAIGLIGSPINGYYRYCLPTFLTMSTSIMALVAAKNTSNLPIFDIDKEK